MVILKLSYIVLNSRYSFGSVQRNLTQINTWEINNMIGDSLPFLQLPLSSILPLSCFIFIHNIYYHRTNILFQFIVYYLPQSIIIKISWSYGFLLLYFWVPSANPVFGTQKSLSQLSLNEQTVKQFLEWCVIMVEAELKQNEGYS